MHVIFLPIHLINFWYVEGLAFFIRLWKNVVLLIEEDLAVGLMYRLLFVPLFHDASFIGRILSLIFRITRIIMGLFAFSMATVLMFVLSIYWFSLPGLIYLNFYPKFHLLIIFSGVVLFLIHVFSHPHKKVWQIKKINDDLWNASLLKKSQIDVKKLLQHPEVELLVSYLECRTSDFSFVKVINLDELGIESFEIAKRVGSPYIGPQHFFVALLNQQSDLENHLLQLGLEKNDFEEALRFLEHRKNKWRVVFIWDEDFLVHHLKGVNRGWLGAPTPALDSVSNDITRVVARYGADDFTGRSDIYNQVLKVLSQDTMRNVLLVAPPGAGKTALINYLAKQIIAGNAPPALATKRLVTLDLTKLLSGVSTQGDVAARVQSAFEEAQYIGDIIIVLEEVHNICLGEAGAQYNLYSLIAPFLDFGNFQFLATTEPENYNRILEKNGVFARLFTKIDLPVAPQNETVEILEDKAIEIERKHKLRVSFLSLKKCSQMTQKYIHDKVLPDSAIAILTQAVTQAQNGWINTNVIESVISERVKVPVLEVDQSQKEQLLDLEQLIKREFKGQEQAVKVVADTLRRSAVSLREGNRPIGSFLFVGPTGVGKTQLAKVISEVYFNPVVIPSDPPAGGESRDLLNLNSVEKDSSTSANSLAFGRNDKVFRFDMSEYQNSESIDRLIGGPNIEGELTEAVLHNQYCLILLDEFEKADPKILTLFLQVLDDGRLTDYSGRTIDFTSTIIIATSNAGSLTIAKGLQQNENWEEIQKKVHEDLLQIYKPELVNRFDEVVLFKPLTHEQLKEIVMLKLADLQKVLKEQGYVVEFNENIINDLAQKGYDPVLGARPLRRLIQDTLEAKLSRLILEGQIKKGISYVY